MKPQQANHPPFHVVDPEGGRMPEIKRLKPKVLLVGDPIKTSLVRRYVIPAFDDKYIRTLGAVVHKTVNVVSPDGASSVQVDFAVTDIMSSKAHLGLHGEAYFQGAKGILAVCDGTKPKSLHELKDWIDAAYATTGEVPTFVLVRVVPDQMVFSDKEIAEFAESYHARFAFTKLETGENVESAFEWMAECMSNQQFPARMAQGAP